MPSGKSSWEKKAHARNAFHNAIKSHMYDCNVNTGKYSEWSTFYDMKPTEVLSYCVEEGIVKFVNLSQEAIHFICEL